MERWHIVQACQELVLRAAAFVDANDAVSFAALFAEDAVLTRPNAEPIEGRAAIRRVYEERPADRMTRHLVTNVLVDLDSQRQARVHSRVLLWTASMAEQKGPNGRRAQARELVGEFDDHLIQTAQDEWLIQRRDASFVLYRDA